MKLFTLRNEPLPPILRISREDFQNFFWIYIRQVLSQRLSEEQY